MPVLAEASVVFAGLSRMPWRRFLTLCALANLGISASYAAVGAYALEEGSFLWLFAGLVGHRRRGVEGLGEPAANPWQQCPRRGVISRSGPMLPRRMALSRGGEFPRETRAGPGL